MWSKTLPTLKALLKSEKIEVGVVEKAIVGIVGAGPLGLELAIELKKNSIPFVIFDKGQVCQAVFDYPLQTHFFSSSERIKISDLPIFTLDQQKCSRENYLNYIRSIVSQRDIEVKSYQKVVEIQAGERPFKVKTLSQEGSKDYLFDYLVLATGGTSYPRILGIPGEDLKHVSPKLQELHCYFQKRVAIIGGKNSAVEAALRCFHAGAHEVRLILRKDEFDAKEIKYWLLPELLGCIHHRQIHCHYHSKVTEIRTGEIEVYDFKNDRKEAFRADLVVKAIGFEADMSLFHQLSIPLTKEQGAPLYDPQTMETPIKGLYVLGTVTGGTQKKFHVFIENCHEHVKRILLSLQNDLGVSLEQAIKPINKTTNSLEE